MVSSALRLLKDVKIGTLCQLEREKSYVCYSSLNGTPNHRSSYMFITDDDIKFVIPLSGEISSYPSTCYILCLVSGIGVTFLGYYSHVEIV